MEITRSNESFVLTETTDLYTISGSVSRDVNGTLNIHFTLNTTEGNRAGDCYYNVYGENAEVSFGVNCREELRNEIYEHSNALVSSVIDYFKALD